LEITVFVVKGVVGDAVALQDMFLGTWWFFVVEPLTLALLIAFPQISLVLPNAMLGRY
jgi:C4-dicarboxylate transporter DctM subunit